MKRDRRREAHLPHFRLIDGLTEAVAGVAQRPARAAMTAFGTVLGVAVLIAVLGLTSTVAAQIDDRFTALSATEVIVDQKQSNGGQPSLEFPPDAEERLERINGVTRAGVEWPVQTERLGLITTRPPGINFPGGRPLQSVPVRAATSGALEVMRLHVLSGAIFGSFADMSGAQVAVLGVAAARELGLTDLNTATVIYIGAAPFTVIGIVDDAQRHPDVLAQIVVPSSTALKRWGLPDGARGARALIEVRPGAASIVASQAALSLRPDKPTLFSVTAPPDATSLRQGVSTDLSQLFLVLAAVCLIVGMVGIANTTLVSVVERIPEIGLRRSMGAMPRHIAAQFLVESGVIGIVGGSIGSALGVVFVIGVALWQHWTAVLAPGVALGGPIVGACTGLLAGAYPAYRASRIIPIDALRSAG